MICVMICMMYTGILAGSWGRPFLSKIPRKNIILIDDNDHYFVKKKGKKRERRPKVR